MKSLVSAKAILFVPLAIASLFSCKKDKLPPPGAFITSATENRTYKDESIGSLSFSRSVRSTVNPGTSTNYYTVEGSGSSTAIPVFNTLISFYNSTSEDGTVSGGEPISSLMPDKLAGAHLAATPHDVHQIVYDNEGNSIWFQITFLSIENSSNIRHFSGTSNIVGGTGKFANASGSVRVNGHMSATNPDDFYIKNEGNISY